MTAQSSYREYFRDPAATEHEEALANANAMRGLRRHAHPRTIQALRAWMRGQPPGYRDFEQYVPPRFVALRYTFSSDDLALVLAPTYIKIFPRTDGWGHDWQFATDEPFPRGNGGPVQVYVIRSAGANGRFDPIVPGPIKYYDCDIVYSNGTFISW